MAEKRPKAKFSAKRWTIVDGKKVELEPVVFHLRQTKKQDSKEGGKKSA